MKSVVQSRTWQVLDSGRKLERVRNKPRLALRAHTLAPARPAPSVGHPAHNKAGLFDYRHGSTNGRREPSHEQAKLLSRNAIEKRPNR